MTSLVGSFGYCSSGGVWDPIGQVCGHESGAVLVRAGRGGTACTDMRCDQAEWPLATRSSILGTRHWPPKRPPGALLYADFLKWVL